jgi:hypothetical protein
VALRPAIAELERLGVGCVLLLAAPDAVAELAAVRELSLPSRAGAYPYQEGRPYQRIASFPSAMVLDDETRVVYADAGPGPRRYTGFVPTASGLADYLRERPRLARGATGEVAR